MSFLLTKYIYPIKNRIVLSNKYKFYLDNPRTKEEINLITNYIKKSYDFKLDDEYFTGLPRFPIKNENTNSESVSLDWILNIFFSNYGKIDKYVKEFANNEKSNNPIEIIGKMWIIARYPLEYDNGSNDNNNYLVPNDYNEEFEFNNSKKLINYSYFLSYLINSDKSYKGDTFIAQRNYLDLSYIQIDKEVNKCILFFSFRVNNHEKYHKSDKWMNFPHIKGDLLKIANDIDGLLGSDFEEKILYISDILRIIGEDFKDNRYILLTLTGILELLLTHNPNYNRFNVEDSISKQFKLKASILIYLNDRTKDIIQIKKRLAEIYNQRSNIAHGNFLELNKYIKKELKKLREIESDTSEDFILDSLNDDLRSFIRAIIFEIIKDPELVKFMKEN